MVYVISGMVSLVEWCHQQSADVTWSSECRVIVLITLERLLGIELGYKWRWLLVRSIVWVSRVWATGV